MRDGNKFFASMLVIAALLAPASVPTAPLLAQEAANTDSASAEFLEIADRHAAAILEISPEFATQLGVGEEIAGDGYARRLSDYSPAGQRQTAALAERLRRELQSVDPDDLSGTAAITYEVMMAAYDLASQQNGFGIGPASTLGVMQPYATDQLFGPHIGLPRLFAAQMQIRSQSELDAFFARIERLDNALDQASSQLRADASRGAAPPKFVLENVASASREFAMLAPSDNPIFTGVAPRIDALENLSIEEREAAKQRLASLLLFDVSPAMLRYGQTASELSLDASSDAGIWRLEDGEELYQTALDNYGADGLTAEQIHEIGLAEVARIHSEMDAILRAEGYSEGAVGERMRLLAANPQYQYADTDASKVEVLGILEGYIDEVERRAPQWFTALPPQAIEVRRIPPHEEGSASGAYYTPPTLDGSQPGIFWMNLKSMGDWPVYTLKSLVYHEAVPGHHFQASSQLVIEDMPLIRNMMWFGDYGEGWALYVEALAVEMGLYEGDDLGNLGRLRMELYRAARLVVDTGIHHKRWGRDQAVDWMVDVTGEPRDSIVREIDRYSVWPGQATSYKIGMIQFQELRASAEERLEDKFDIRRFHDFVLSTGNVPMGVLTRLLDDWIEEQERT